MKATGIVRRIDDLGRVVIPKEIRRTLRIREGDLGKKIPHAATKDPHLEPACQCRRHGFDPRPGKIAHVE